MTDAATRARELVEEYHKTLPLGTSRDYSVLIDAIARALADAEQRAQRAEAERDEHRTGRDANAAEVVHWMRRAQEVDIRNADLERHLADARRALEEARARLAQEPGHAYAAPLPPGTDRMQVAICETWRILDAALGGTP